MEKENLVEILMRVITAPNENLVSYRLIRKTQHSDTGSLFEMEEDIFKEEGHE